MFTEDFRALGLFLGFQSYYEVSPFWVRPEGSAGLNKFVALNRMNFY